MLKPSQSAFLDVLKCMNYPKVLDFGCKSGEFWDDLSAFSETYGCDITLHPKMRERLQRNPGQFRISHDPHRIPFEDSMFDFVFANSVFEHVEPLPSIVQECARVLKPGGRLVAILPTKSVLLEPHIRVPFASHLKPGVIRQSWIRIAYTLGFGKSYAVRHGGVMAASKHAESYLSEATFYRSHSDLLKLLREHFSQVEDRTSVLIRAKSIPLIPGLASVVSRLYAVYFDAKK